jgi:hypothetical protein
LTRMLKVGGALLGIFLVLVVSVVGWLWWQSNHPTLPKGWPIDSSWQKASDFLPGWLGLVGVGSWTSCEFDSKRSADTCKFADFRGKHIYEGEYSTCDGRSPIQGGHLRLSSRRQSTTRVFLQDGTMLLPKEECPEKAN